MSTRARSTHRARGAVSRVALTIAAALVCALAGVAAIADAAPGNARMRAEVRPSEIPLGQTARLVVTITGSQNAAPPRVPPIDGLTVQSLGQTTSVQIVNGTVTAEVAYNFLLEPQRSGQFTIPALQTVVEGERLSTSPMRLRVVDANAVPRGGIAPRGAAPSRGADAEEAAAPIRLRVNAPQRDLYVGELLPVELVLEIREGVRVTEVTAPVFEGDAFTVSRPADGQPSQTTEVIDGVRWVIATFPLAISPVSSGEFPLVGKIEVTAYMPGARRRFGGTFDDPLFESFFGGSGGAPRKIPLSTESRKVRVLPLPDEGRPADFSGAIGKFTVEASATPTKITAGDPVTLTVKVAGTGNFDRLSIPEMTTDQDWKTYPASTKFEPTDALGTTGRKVSEQAIVPQSPKITAVPARPFSYFDPERKRYVEITTQPIALTIAPAPQTKQRSASGAPAGTSRDAVPAEEWELAPNQIAPGTPQDPVPVTSRPWFIALQLVPPIVLLAGTWWVRRRERLAADPAHQRRLAARRGVDAELAALKRARAAGDAAAFFVAARRAVQQQLAADPEHAASLTLADLESLTAAHPELRDEVRAIVGRADAVAYSAAPVRGDELQTWEDRVTSLLRALATRVGAIVLALATLGLVAATTPCSAAEPPAMPDAATTAAAPPPAAGGTRAERFEAANTAFAEGRFADARAGFAAMVAQDGPSVPVLYNLGNAAFRDGRIGEAILSYERALLLAPRDPDTRANLRQVRKAAGLPEPDDGPWTRATRALTASAWAWLASGGLYLACAALLGLRALRGDATRTTLRSALRTAVACGAALIVVGAAACATRLAERDRAVVLDDDPVLRVAPYASATASSELAPGEIVRIERTHDGFTLVRTAAGRSGWTTSAGVARIAFDR